MGSRIVVRGAKDLRRGLRRVEADLKDLTRLHKKMADYAAIVAGSKAPVDSGELGHSIKGSGTQRKARIRSALEYAPVQEYGWPARNIRGRHFMDDTVTEVAPKLAGWYAKEIAEIGRRAGFRTTGRNARQD